MHSSRLWQNIAFCATALFAIVAFADEPTPFAEDILDVVDTVLSKHIEPPSRQQMVLHGARQVYKWAKTKPPMDLAAVVSDLSDRDDCIEFLTDLHRDIGLHPELTRRKLLHGVADSVPGGVSVETAKAAKVEEQLAANRYVGIGIALMMNNGPAIGKVIYDGPGWRSGVEEGDRILKIDGQSTADWEISQVLEELRGEEGSNVVLTLKQPDKNDERIVEVTRGVTFIPTIVGKTQTKSSGEWSYDFPSEPGFALLTIVRIGPSTIHELKKIEAKLRTTNLKGIVIDLRRGGGLLHDTVLLADQFLEEGTIGFEVRRDKETKYEARSGSLFTNVPMAVVVDAMTGPAQVFLACALQDQQRATVVGKPNQNQVFVKRSFDLPDGKRLTFAGGQLKRSSGILLTHQQTVPQQLDGVRFFPYGPNAARQVNKSVFPFIMPDHIVADRGDQDDDPYLTAAVRSLQNAATANTQSKGVATKQEQS